RASIAHRAPPDVATLSSSPVRAAPPAGARVMRVLAFAITAAAGAGGALALRAAGDGAAPRVMPSVSAAVSAVTSTVPRPTPITELPMPESGQREAIAAYRSAMQMIRDGALPDAVQA